MTNLQQTVKQNMTKFLVTQTNLTNTDDLRLQAILKKGSQGNIVIIGSPFDYVRKRSIQKGGQQNGPCCLRRFFHRVGPIYNSQYQINIANLNVSDYGNIHIEQQQQQKSQLISPQRVISKIQQQILSIFKNNNNQKFPFVYGGSKQCSLASARAFHKKYSSSSLISKHLIISGLPFLKRPFDNDKLTSDSLLSILNRQFPGKQILFGPHEKYFMKLYQKNFQYVSFNQIYYNQDSKKIQKIQKQLGFSTAPVRKIKKVIQKQQNTVFHVTLSVQAIQRFLGCRDLPLHGIKPQQMTQIFYLFGQLNCIRSIDITQFNPSCQDYQSSLILVNLLYYFLMGYTKRQKLVI